MGVCTGRDSVSNLPRKIDQQRESGTYSQPSYHTAAQSPTTNQRHQCTQTILRNSTYKKLLVKKMPAMLYTSDLKPDSQNVSPGRRRTQHMLSLATKDPYHPSFAGSNQTADPTLVAHDFLDSPVAKAFESPRFSDASCISFNDMPKSEMNSLMIFPGSDPMKSPNNKDADDGVFNLHPNLYIHSGVSVATRSRRSFFKSREISATSTFEFKMQKVPSTEIGKAPELSENLPISPVTHQMYRHRLVEEQVSRKSSIGSKCDSYEKAIELPRHSHTRLGSNMQGLRSLKEATGMAGQRSLCSIRKEFKIPPKVRLRRCQSVIISKTITATEKTILKPLVTKVHESGYLPSRGQKFIPRRSFTLSNLLDSIPNKLGSSGEEIGISQYQYNTSGVLEKSRFSALPGKSAHRSSAVNTSLALRCAGLLEKSSHSPDKPTPVSKPEKYPGYFPIVVKKAKCKKPKLSDFERKVKTILKRREGSPTSIPKPMIFINGEFHCLLK